jgi:hypothetical protein
LIRRFRLNRENDVTGISGTGIVAEGAMFGDGTVALRWLTEWRSVVFYEQGMEAVERIHGHHGGTRVEWVDE